MTRGLWMAPPAILLSGISLLVVAWAEPPVEDGDLPGAETASLIRETLGVGPSDVATASVGEIEHDGLINLVAAEASLSDELGVLAADYDHARTDLIRCGSIWEPTMRPTRRLTLPRPTPRARLQPASNPRLIRANIDPT